MAHTAIKASKPSITGSFKLWKSTVINKNDLLYIRLLDKIQMEGEQRKKKAYERPSQTAYHCYSKDHVLSQVHLEQVKPAAKVE